jgi:hypothetical protein
VQKDDPDDATADGADMMDGTRYIVMTWLGPLEEPRLPAFRSVAQQIKAELEALDHPAYTTPGYTVIRQ